MIRMGLLTLAILLSSFPVVFISHDKAYGAEHKGGPLGDLSKDMAIVKDTLKLAKSESLTSAKARIKDLETVWDEAEDKQRPLSPADWEDADKAIDHALAKLREAKPDRSASVSALETLLSVLEKLNKPK